MSTFGFKGISVIVFCSLSTILFLLLSRAKAAGSADFKNKADLIISTMKYLDTIFFLLISLGLTAFRDALAASHGNRQQLAGTVAGYVSKATPLVAVITGMEHSGTTVLSGIVKSHSNISAGFECGIFLGTLATFGDQTPFAEWMSMGEGNFGLPSTYLRDIANMSYADAIVYINDHKGTSDNSDMSVAIRSGSWLVDKTPRYVYDVPSLMEKLNTIGHRVPVFIILKPFVDIMDSIAVKRNDTSVEQAYALVVLCLKSLKEIHPHGKRVRHVYVISYLDLIKRQAKINEFMMTVLRRYQPALTFERLSYSRYVCETEKMCDQRTSAGIHETTQDHARDIQKALKMTQNMTDTKEEFDQLVQSLKVKFH